MTEAPARRWVASTLLVMLAVAACSQVTDDTGLTKSQQGGIVGGAAAGALVAAAADAGTGWIAGAAVLGAAAGGGIATLGGEGESSRPTQGTLDQFAASPPGSERTWRDPATGDHGTVKILSAFQKPDGTSCKRLEETMWLTGSGEQRINATACATADGHWQIVDLTPVATE